MAAVDNIPLPPGFDLGRYTIEKRISSGGFGVVYAAHRDDGLRVAIKEFLPSSMACRLKLGDGRVAVVKEQDAHRYKQGLQNFFEEADTLAKIRTPHVVPVWDVFMRQGTAYFVMPLERGMTLHQWIRSAPGPVPDRLLQRVFAEAAQGVSVLHDHGLLHLDIKPGNLWVRPDGSVVVLDLGASWWSDDLIRRRHAARTPGFAAPEQHGKATIRPDIRTDVYGLGATLWSCLCDGTPPPPAPLRRPGEPGLAFQMAGQRSPALLRLVDKAVALDRADRWSTVHEFRVRLASLPRLSAHAVSHLGRVGTLR